MPKIRAFVAGSAALAAAVTTMAAAPSIGAPAASQVGGAVAGDRVSDLRAIGLTGNGRLVRFDVNAPGRSSVIDSVTGLRGDDRLIGIDFRVQNGKLYGVGNAGGIYIISVGTAKATKVSQLTTALMGNQFGVDFNPAADRLRIVSDTGQNLRHDLTGTDMPATTVDVMLTYPPATTAATGITAVAYTNNDLDVGTGTTLFDIDTNLDQVAIQSPANNGTLSLTGTLGIDANARAGFDIYSDLDRDARTTGLQSYAVLRDGDGAYKLYSVSLLNGDVSREGAFRNRMAVVDVALPLNQR